MFNLGSSYFHVALTTVRHPLNVDTYGPVSHGVDGDGHVAWLGGARVEVVVVERQQVDVVEDETVPVIVTQCRRLREPDVQQHAAIERTRRRLRRDTPTCILFSIATGYLPPPLSPNICLPMQHCHCGHLSLS